MINTFSKKAFLTWALGLSVTVGSLEAKEPNPAPAEYGSIPSPRMVVKPSQAQRKNQDLLKLVEEAIEISGRRYLIANQHSPWQIYHGLNALRNDFQLELDGELVNAVEWLSTTNPQFRGTAWFEKTLHGGRAHRYTVPYHFEGHPNQSLALMVMCNLPPEHEFAVDGGTITVADIINNAKVDLNPVEEQTWTLWFLTHYLNSDESWRTRRGDVWSIERLVQDQIQTQVTKAACGGTHNLYALSVARNNHLRRGGDLRGVWMQADQKIKRYMVAAKSLQRPDGSFPTNYFRGYGSPKSFSEQIASTGHMMEWLMVAADDRQISQEWMERGIRYIAQKLVDNRNESAECGPLYHSVSALVLYRDRVNGVAWPDPAIQNQQPVLQQQENLVKQAPLPEVVPAPSSQGDKESAQMAAVPQVAAKPESEESPVISPSVSDQSAQGKMSAGINDPEMELEFQLPVQGKKMEQDAKKNDEVEILAAPEDDQPTK